MLGTGCLTWINLNHTTLTHSELKCWPEIFQSPNTENNETWFYIVSTQRLGNFTCSSPWTNSLRSPWKHPHHDPSCTARIPEAGSKSCDQSKWKCFDLHLGSFVLTWRQETCKTHVENIIWNVETIMIRSYHHGEWLFWGWTPFRFPLPNLGKLCHEVLLVLRFGSKSISKSIPGCFTNHNRGFNHQKMGFFRWSEHPGGEQSYSWVWNPSMDPIRFTRVSFGGYVIHLGMNMWYV